MNKIDIIEISTHEMEIPEFTQKIANTVENNAYVMLYIEKFDHSILNPLFARKNKEKMFHNISIAYLTDTFAYFEYVYDYKPISHIYFYYNFENPYSIGRVKKIKENMQKIIASSKVTPMDISKSNVNVD